MKKKWFVNKCYGYGVMPVSWEGWLATLVLLGLVLVSAYTNFLFEPELLETEPRAILRFVFDGVLLIGLFLLFAERHMDEPLEWRWGRKK